VADSSSDADLADRQASLTHNATGSAACPRWSHRQSRGGPDSRSTRIPVRTLGGRSTTTLAAAPTGPWRIARGRAEGHARSATPIRFGDDGPAEQARVIRARAPYASLGTDNDLLVQLRTPQVCRPCRRPRLIVVHGAPRDVGPPRPERPSMMAVLEPRRPACIQVVPDVASIVADPATTMASPTSDRHGRRGPGRRGRQGRHADERDLWARAGPAKSGQRPGRWQATGHSVAINRTLLDRRDGRAPPTRQRRWPGRRGARTCRDRLATSRHRTRAAVAAVVAADSISATCRTSTGTSGPGSGGTASVAMRPANNGATPTTARVRAKGGSEHAREQGPRRAGYGSRRSAVVGRRRGRDRHFAWPASSANRSLPAR
jgi:hypothetical protein